ncbi:mating-type protein A-alpha Z4 [Schizophyllum commune H4-8]|uniref:A-alpha Z4, HD1 mating type protein n=1 Tax=Schizophyllum commune (strain H4-8 / FGSC 9210) TaxID=578458 RepID=D8PR90_SCHCM|nr:mating-type protein A-alpha Z4 [Schizophyllum commune H4-8]KAI5898045.1 mating-type protein A-alpha Z4 [Schizophyllum commune H4-8]
MSLYSAEDILEWLHHAQAEFLTALAEGDDALAQFQAQWDRVRACVDCDPTLPSSTLALSHAVGISIAQIAEVMLDQEATNHTIEDELTKDLLAGLERHDASSALADEKTGAELSATPLPPYIEPCYRWLVNHLDNPYPTKAIKEELLDQARQRTSPDVAQHLALGDIDNWFIAARARMGWGDIRRRLFGGSRSLMLQSTRLMWGTEETSRDFTDGCIAKRKGAQPKREEVQPHLRSSHDVVAFKIPPKASPACEEPLHPQSFAALQPDVEFALAHLEVNAKEMYGLEPTELADSLNSSAVDRQFATQDLVAFRAALEAATAAKQRQARREQRRAQKDRMDAQRRAEDRKCYPSPEPLSADELSGTESDEDLDDFYASDDASDDEDDDGEDLDTRPSDLMAQMCPQLVATAFSKDGSATEDEDSNSDDTDESTDDEDEDSDSENDSDSEDEEEEDEEEEEPVKIAGAKRGRNDDEEVSPLAKKPRIFSPPVRPRPQAIRVSLPSPAPSSRGSTPTSPVSPSPKAKRPAQATSLLASHPMKKREKLQEELRKAGLAPPSAPVLMGPDGVPLGTVRSRSSPSVSSPPSVSVSLPLPSRGVPSGGIKVTGDPTPWVNWDLEAHTQAPRDLTAATKSSAGCSVDAVPLPGKSRSLTRSPSISSISSACSTSSSGSDTDSLFSVTSDATDITEPDEATTADETTTQSTSASSSRDTTSQQKRMPPLSIDPRFDPALWSKYDLSPPADGRLHPSDGLRPSAFVPTKLDVRVANLAQNPARHWSASKRSPTRASHAAAPIVSYHHATGSIASPAQVAFGEGQLTSVLATGQKAGNARRRTTPVQRRVTPKAQETSEPSSLVDGILSSGLADVCREAPKPAKAPKNDRRYLERRERRLSKSSPVDSADTVRTRLAEIEQEAARLEAERQSLQRLASVGG